MDEIEKIQWPGWETVRIIGRGSFGAVYEIQRTVFDDVDKAALKVISIPYNRSDIDEMYSDGYDEETITSVLKDHLKSIVAEYSLMRKMNGSANVVSCDDVQYIPHEDGPGWDVFIKMELLTPLSKSLQEKFDDQTVIEVGIGICNALELCKQYGIVHRDIKPQNIFVSPHGDYKLGDFGIAKTIEKTIGGTKIGTYKYMAPEVYNNQPYGSGADIYSLGLVLYWMLNERRLPFLPLPPKTPTAAIDEEARRRRFTGERIPAPAHGSEELKKIILKACAFAPKDRYASASEMKAALLAIRRAPEAIGGIMNESRQPADLKSPITAEDDNTVGVWSAYQREQKTAEQVENEIPTERHETEDFRNSKSSDDVGFGMNIEKNLSARIVDSNIGNKESLSSQRNNFDEVQSHQNKTKGKKGVVAIIAACLALVLLICLIFPQFRKDGTRDEVSLRATATTNSTDVPTITQISVKPTATEATDTEPAETETMEAELEESEPAEIETTKATETTVPSTEAIYTSAPKYQVGSIYHSFAGDENIWADISYWWEYIDDKIYVYIEPRVNIGYFVEAYPAMWTGSVFAGKRDGSYPLDYSWYGGEAANWERDLYTIIMDKSMPSGEYVWKVDEYENGSGAFIGSVEVIFVLEND